nr:uncharacterized protein LOC109178464 [Ipomoea trifida]
MYDMMRLSICPNDEDDADVAKGSVSTTSTSTSVPPSLPPVLPVLTPSIPVVSPSSSDDISNSSRSVPAVPESDHTPSSSPAPNLSRTTSSPTVSESSSAEQPAASVLVPSVSPATAPDLPAVSGRPARIRKPNSRYYGDQFVNITTVHPMPLALEPRTCEFIHPYAQPRACYGALKYKAASPVPILGRVTNVSPYVVLLLPNFPIPEYLLSKSFFIIKACSLSFSLQNSILVMATL